MKEKKGLRSLPKWLRRTLIAVLCAALGGGGIYGILLLVRGSSGAVNVYPVMAFCTNYADDRAETQGMVTPDKLQSVYVSETQKVTKFYVREGDSVKAGDPVLSFDTTLTDLELERQRIAVEKLKLDLAEAERNLARVNTYRVFYPGRAAGGGGQEMMPEPVYPALDLPFFRTGNGTEGSPYVYVWNDRCSFDTAFIDRILPQLPEGFDPSADTPPSVCAVFEVREGDSLEGGILRSWLMTFWRTETGGVEFTIQEASGNYDGSAPPEGGDELPVNVNTTPAYSYNELMEMRREAQNKIVTLELDLKKAELQYETLQFELTSGLVTSKIDGVVKTVRDPDAAREEGLPTVLISGGGGFFATGALSETELNTIHVGDTVTVMSWQTYSQNEAEIISISEYPAEGGNYYHWSQGNSNSSLYPFTVYLDEDTPVREGEWVNITYNPFGDTASGFFLENMFLRREGGRSYVFVRGEDGRLIRREVSTGRSLWGTYTQILGGLSPEDFIAFPYGRTVREGARTEMAPSDALYSY